MPGNVKGGKGYKKGKNSSDQEVKFVSCQEGQIYGRALKALGNRRFRVFCNDSVERICKLRGSMRKSDWVEEGTLVILSIRDFTNATTGSNEVEVGDILVIVDPRTYGKIKKEEGINPLLFTNIEEQDGNELKRKIRTIQEGKDLEIEDDLFDRGDCEEGDEENSEDEENVLTKEDYAKNSLIRGQTIAKARDQKYNCDTEDIDIDAL
jgi:initiation factor 1A